MRQVSGRARNRACPTNQKQPNRRDEDSAGTLGTEPYTTRWTIKCLVLYAAPFMILSFRRDYTARRPCKRNGGRWHGGDQLQISVKFDSSKGIWKRDLTQMKLHSFNSLAAFGLTALALALIGCQQAPPAATAATPA